MAEPRTTREALVAELLGDLDSLLTRVETLPRTFADAEAKLTGTVSCLNSAGDQFRMAITAFTSEARGELTDFLQRKAGEVASRTVDEQRAAIQEAARSAFESAAFDKASQLVIALGQAAKEFRRATLSRVVEHGLIAVGASLLTAGLVLYMR